MASSDDKFRRDKGGGGQEKRSSAMHPVRDSGYLTEDHSPKHATGTRFFLGDGPDIPPATSRNNDDVFGVEDILDDDAAREQSPPIDIPQRERVSQPTNPFEFPSHFTPPRAYQLPSSHLSTGSLRLHSQVSVEEPVTDTRHVSTQIPSFHPSSVVLDNAVRQQHTPPHNHQDTSRKRFMSEAFLQDIYDVDDEDDIDEPANIPQRPRSKSAPVILTPAQRFCACELRRISDEFDRDYRRCERVDRQTTTDNNLSSSFPRTRHNPGWWHSVVQYLPPRLLPRRHSPIAEHNDDSDIPES